MTHYIDIRLFPNKEIRENVLLNQIYTTFHKRLYDLKSASIGVSFPEYNLKLGRLFRIHGTKEVLEKLSEKDWLGKYKLFCKVENIKEIPQHVQYRTVSRIQQNMTEAKLRRLIKRGTITEEDIKKYRIKMYQGGLENPYVELVSMSNGKLHRRFIEFGELKKEEVKGDFDLFGLSKISTIPWF
ncbi:MAG: type I-F CRISPR-associated endoribonuclease Cas6/Csy4 [Sulfurovum sp.]|nr:type I-F CRISPR-associated endoribonuclease Cas6/Csy4 [Sulfurovum sp.]